MLRVEPSDPHDGLTSRTVNSSAPSSSAAVAHERRCETRAGTKVVTDKHDRIIMDCVHVRYREDPTRSTIEPPSTTPCASPNIWRVPPLGALVGGRAGLRERLARLHQHGARGRPGLFHRIQYGDVVENVGRTPRSSPRTRESPCGCMAGRSGKRCRHSRARRRARPPLPRRHRHRRSRNPGEVCAGLISTSGTPRCGGRRALAVSTARVPQSQPSSSAACRRSRNGGRSRERP